MLFSVYNSEIFNSLLPIKEKVANIIVDEAKHIA